MYLLGEEPYFQKKVIYSLPQVRADRELTPKNHNGKYSKFRKMHRIEMHVVQTFAIASINGLVLHTDSAIW